MCGIAGVLHHARSEPVDPATLVAMRDAMRHRGPDGEGLWLSTDGRIGLAHRRLAIIDLSASARQPMCNEDGQLWISFNGEIYNHLGLRRELLAAGHRFATDHSDTEVLLHGYEQWGIDGLLSRIAGDYAFALWDQRRQRLTLARDRIGVKPLYFTRRDGRFAFASEIKALVAGGLVRPRLDRAAMHHYLSFLTTPAPMTMFDGVWKLPAGMLLEVSADGSCNTRRYWDAVPGRGIAAGVLDGLSEAAREDFYVRGIRERLERAVERRMMSDVPFGVFLSGGIDSSTNVALMSRHTERPLQTFTVGFRDHTHLNELDHASAVARRFATEHHEILIDESDMLGYLDQLVHVQDEPIADWVCIPLHFVSRLTRDSGVTVIQVGEGSDEQFCGYASYMGYLRLYHRYWQPFRRYLPRPVQRAAGALALALGRCFPRYAVHADLVQRAAQDREHFWSGAFVFPEYLKAELLHIDHAPADTARLEEAAGLLPAGLLQPDTFNVVHDYFRTFDAAFPGRDALTRMIYSEFRLRLPELLLMRVDKITMACSLEARVPFLDHELVEFSMDIPEHWKTRHGVAKYLLKKAVGGLIPEQIIHRRKMGFGAPMSQWLRQGFGAAAEATVLGSRLMDEGRFKVDAVRRLFAEHRSGRRDASLYLWTLFNLAAWYDYWVSA